MISDRRGDKTRYLFKNYLIFIIGGCLTAGSIFLNRLLDDFQKLILSFDVNQHLVADAHLLSTALQEFGIAFIIASIIAYSIEMVSRQEFNDMVERRIEEIQKHVFRSTYGRNVTAGLIDEVEQLVLGARFMRHNHRITYQLQRCRAKGLDDSDDAIPDIEIVTADVNITYEVENISSVPQTCPIQFYVERPPFESLCRFISIEKIVIDGEEIKGDFLTSLISETDEAIRFSKEIENVRPGQRVRVHGAWRAIKLPTDVELWRSFLPSEGMTLCANFPHGTEEKGANAVHRLDVTTKHLSPNYGEWSIEGTVLPQQGIVFWWRCGAGNQSDFVLDKTMPCQAPGQPQHEIKAQRRGGIKRLLTFGLYDGN